MTPFISQNLVRSQKMRWLVGSCVGAVLAIGTAPVGSAGEFAQALGASGIVESLVSASDLGTVSRAGAANPSARTVRQITDSLSRSTTTESGGGPTAPDEMFSRSKAVVPLLVIDLEPSVATVSRPMSGPSVGTRPSLPWSKSSAPR